MGILGRILVMFAAALAGCYSPQVRDCTVSCAARDDCTSGQICGRDGLCAAPELAGRCASAAADAGVDAGSDGSGVVSLRVQVTGKGSVVIWGRGTCSSQDPQRGDCTYDVAPGTTQTVFAVQIDMKEVFTGWTSATCAGQDDNCSFIPAGPTTIVAKFEHSDGSL